MRRGALRSALSERLREGNLVVVDFFGFEQPKTKEFISALAALGLEGKTLVVDTLDNERLVLASRNVRRAKVVSSRGVNIYDVLYHEKIVLSRKAAEELGRALDPKAQGAESENGGGEGAAEATGEEAA
jgi:large subunit ribosomal protein L4